MIYTIVEIPSYYTNISIMHDINKDSISVQSLSYNNTDLEDIDGFINSIESSNSNNVKHEFKIVPGYRNILKGLVDRNIDFCIAIPYNKIDADFVKSFGFEGFSDLIPKNDMKYHISMYNDYMDNFISVASKNKIPIFQIHKRTNKEIGKLQYILPCSKIIDYYKSNIKIINI